MPRPLAPRCRCRPLPRRIPLRRPTRSPRAASSSVPRRAGINPRPNAPAGKPAGRRPSCNPSRFLLRPRVSRASGKHRPQLFCHTNQLFCLANQLFCHTNQLFCLTNQLFCLTNQLFCLTDQLFLFRLDPSEDSGEDLLKAKQERALNRVSMSDPFKGIVSVSDGRSLLDEIFPEGEGSQLVSLLKGISVCPSVSCINRCLQRTAPSRRPPRHTSPTESTSLRS